MKNLINLTFFKVERKLKLAMMGLKVKKKVRFSNMCKTWGRIRIRSFIVLMLIRIRIRIWIDINMEIRIRIRIGIKTMPIHNTAESKILS
jgi:hypothetical protein